MIQGSDPVTKLIAELSKLPGIGEKTATRLAFHILKSDRPLAESLANSILNAKDNIRLCSKCMTFSEREMCNTCSDASRNPEIICVVEKPSDVYAIEASGQFKGTYHTLHGLLSPLDGIGPAQLYIKELLTRLQDGAVHEVILALNSSVEAEATGVYLTKLLKPLGITVSRIAHGIPVGGVLEYLDRQTISRALENRIVSQ